MSWTNDVLVTLAEHLAAHGVGTWRPAGAYQPGDAAPILIGSMPSSPHELIVLSGYPVEDDPSLSDSVLGVQVRTRGIPDDPDGAGDLDDDVFDALHGLRGVPTGTGRLVQVLRRSGAPLAQDESRRYERSSNYYVTAHRPSTHRL